MAWDTSNRRERLPSNWEALRLRVLQRDHYQCQAKDTHGRKCLRPANQCDHIVHGDDHSMSNLQALCTYCHGRKSSQEGADARAAARAAAPARRPELEHPLDALKRKRSAALCGPESARTYPDTDAPTFVAHRETSTPGGYPLPRHTVPVDEPWRSRCR